MWVRTTLPALPGARYRGLRSTQFSMWARPLSNRVFETLNFGVAPWQISNYEIGVVFPLKDVQHVDRVACWERPPRKYASGDEPWVSAQLLCSMVDPSVTCLVRSKKSRSIINPPKSYRTFDVAFPDGHTA